MKIIHSILFASTLAVMCTAGLMASSGSRARESVQIEGRQIDVSMEESRRPPARNAHPTIGLALGGGGLRGLAHIGVLEALEEAGIKPDIVVGTSAGALVGALYASGMTPAQIKKLANETKISSFVDFTLSTDGLMRGDNIATWVNSTSGNIPIEHFPKRFAAVATDLRMGAPVLIEHGDAGNAVRASASVPGVQVPVPYRSGYLVDGGVSSLVPVRAARALGADIVIAVDIYCNGNEKPELNAAAVLRQAMHTQSCLLAAPEIADADIRIQPEVAVPSLSDKEAQRKTIRIGYEAARKVLAVAGLKGMRSE